VGAISLQRILLADDEPDVLEVSRIALETVGGFEVAVCNSGAELLRRLPDFSPDLIIIDVMMPDMAGPEVLDRVRQIPGFGETPVVFLTGVMSGDELKNLRNSGAADVILKPFDPMTLADRIGGIWGLADD
jgi:two-component system OmpR family response regulator